MVKKPDRKVKGLKLLSIIIPARNEAEALPGTLRHLRLELSLHKIPHEILVVDDGSEDGTAAAVQEMETNPEADSKIRLVTNPAPHGFGRAVTAGLKAAQGDAMVIFMADESDDPRDVVTYWNKLGEGYDCVFGSRFMRGGGTIGYPKVKWLLNRMANTALRLAFQHGLDDTTNAFKAYRRNVIDNLHPILSPHFNITVELPLKAITRGFSFAIVPITWRNRRFGESKLKIREMGSRYLFIAAHIWLEKYFTGQDYHPQK